MATARRPSALVGSGMVFVNNKYVGHCTRCEISYDVGESVGRFKGHVIESTESNKDVFLNLHMDDLRPENARVWLNNHASSFASLTSAPALTESSMNFNHVEPIKLIDSATAVTLSQAGASNLEVFKRDFSVKYAVTTDYTVSSSEVTRVNGGNISSGQEVLAAYTAADASAVNLLLGKGQGRMRTSVLVSMIESATGKIFQFSHNDAALVGPRSLVFEHGADWGGIDIQFRLFADLDAANDCKYGYISWGSAAVKAVGN